MHTAAGILVLAVLWFAAGCGNDRELPYVAGYKVVAVYPHDPRAFTQGLLWHDGALYESTGLRGESTIRKVELQSGAVLMSKPLPSAMFGEGMTVWGDLLIQLTWQSHVGFVWQASDFGLVDTFRYPGEGWGLTHDGHLLIMSDGTDTLRFLDPTTFQEVARLRVSDGRGPVNDLNELEYVRGEVWANVLKTEWIVRIDPETGQVLGWVDLRGLLTAEENGPAGVMNGIAYDAEEDRLFVTGKLWPKLFEVEVVPAQER